MNIFSIVIIAAKFLIPILLLFFPFIAAWSNYILDIIDGDLLQFFGMNDYTYQTIDKTADLFSYVCMLLLGVRWKIKNTIIILFVYRLIGQLLFL